MFADEGKVKGCLVGGMVNDAFGAPEEALKRVNTIKKKYGAQGLQEFTYYKSPWDKYEREGVGIITDDTTQTACTLASLIETAYEKDFEEKSLNMMWQYFMLWGQKQKYGRVIEKAAAIDVQAPDYLQPFLFRCGAGLNTLAGLSVGYRGSIDRPLKYKRTIDKRVLKSPNLGCGGQMRIAPVAFLYDDVDLVPYTMQACAITHNHPDAIAATCATALTVANALKYGTLKEALAKTKENLKEISDNKGVLQSWRLAENAFGRNKTDMQSMSDLGKKQGRNAFLALPVLTQTIFALHVAADIDNPQPEDFKYITRLSANHTGDSDSVAAIVGNVVGASWGYDVLPQDWVDIVQQKDDVLFLADKYLTVARAGKLHL